MSTLTDAITGLQTAITGHDAAIASLSGLVTSLNASVANLTAQVAAATANAANTFAQSDVDAITAARYQLTTTRTFPRRAFLRPGPGVLPLRQG